MKTVYIIAFLLASVILTGCEMSYNEAKRQSKAEHEKRQKEDSAALKIGVMPTLDCLPIYVAKEYGLFDSLKTDIRLKLFKSQTDCDAALENNKIEGNVTDIVRGQYMKTRGVELNYIAATNAYWQLISNRKARIKNLRQLNEKMIAMTRFSATALLSDIATDSAKLKQENVFKIQINDLTLRLQMLLNNEMDAMFLTEPQATTARLYKNHLLMDSRDKDMYFGVIAFNSKTMKDKNRQKQLQAFIKGYNQACDMINKRGLKNFSSLLEKYCKTDSKTIKELPEMKFEHAGAPRQKDIHLTDNWLKRNN